MVVNPEDGTTTYGPGQPPSWPPPVGGPAVGGGIEDDRLVLPLPGGGWLEIPGRLVMLDMLPRPWWWDRGAFFVADRYRTVGGEALTIRTRMVEGMVSLLDADPSNPACLTLYGSGMLRVEVLCTTTGEPLGVVDLHSGGPGDRDSVQICIAGSPPIVTVVEN